MEGTPRGGLTAPVLCQVLHALSGPGAAEPFLAAALERLTVARWAAGVAVYTSGETGGPSLLVHRGEGPVDSPAAQDLARQSLAKGAPLDATLLQGPAAWRLLAAPAVFGGEGLGVLVAARPQVSNGTPEQWLQEGEAVGLLLGMALANLHLKGHLQARQREQEALLQRLLQAQEEERRRIARGLHDDISQALLALSLRIDDLRDRCTPGAPLDRADFSALKQALYEALDQVHRIIFNLRPQILDDMGLVPAAMWLAQEHLQRKGVETSFEVNGRQRRLPEPVETVAFRVIQEAVQNIQRHARAKSAHLALTFGPDALDILILDDGQGFDPDEVRIQPGQSRGLGLLGMRERLALVHGTLTLISKPGRGTTIRVRIPLAGAEHESDGGVAP
ncbi:MAG: sensor histidine kinase [Anaerolineae bacterium]